MSIALFVGAFIVAIAFIGSLFLANDKLSDVAWLIVNILNAYILVVMVLAGIALL